MGKRKVVYEPVCPVCIHAVLGVVPQTSIATSVRSLVYLWVAMYLPTVPRSRHRLSLVEYLFDSPFQFLDLCLPCP